jgi:acyl carrier protein
MMDKTMISVIQVLKDFDLIENENDVYTESFKSAILELDSISYISVMVEIENFLNITLPDKVLESNMLMDIPRLVEIISACSNHGQIHLEI